MNVHAPYGKFIADGRCPCCGRSEPLWTPAAIVEAMQTWAERHGRTPSSHDWVRAGRGHPSYDQVKEVFGSMRSAHDAAGLVFLRGNQHRRWTREQVCQAFYRWVFEKGRLPSSHQWNVGSGEFPSTSTVRRLFGSWNGAVVAAGYEPSHRRRNDKSYRASMAAVTKKEAA